MRHFINHTEENYLKAIFSLTENTEKGVNTNSIAKSLDTKASSVTEMMKKLSEKGLVTYKKYYGVNLTSNGQKIALSTIRKHRLWEVFLVEKLNFNWDEVHEIAEQLEHISSPELVNRLDNYLGNPGFDPHGDPIPNKNGEFPKSFSRPLVKLGINQQGQVVGVSQDTPSFLQYLDKLHIRLGSTIKVIDKVDFDHSLELKINNKSAHISAAVAKNILIKLK